MSLVVCKDVLVRSNALLCMRRACAHLIFGASVLLCTCSQAFLHIHFYVEIVEPVNACMCTIVCAFVCACACMHACMHVLYACESLIFCAMV